MKKIKLYLTSLLQEMTQEMEELGAFVGDLNDRYQSQDLYFQLNTTGESDPQEDIQAVKDSELYYIIFHTEPQDQARAEFEAAYTSFLEKKAPKIVTYYKSLAGDKPDESAAAFMDKLGNELGHFYSKYTHMDTIKLNLLLQLKALGLEHIKVEVVDSAVVVDSKEMMDLDNIPMMFNNKNLATLKEQHAAMEKEFWELSEKTHKDPSDKEAKKRFMQLSGQMSQVDETLHELQKNILEMETSFLEKAGKGYLTPRLVQARQRFEEGDLEGAKKLLDFDKMASEDEKEDELFELQQKKELAKVSEYIFRADMFKTEYNNPDRFFEIERSYEKAIERETKYNLPERTAAYQYAKYLYEQNNYGKSLEILDALLHWLLGNKKESYDIARAYNMAGNCHSKQNQFAEAADAYQKALDIREKLAEEEGASAQFDSDLALSYNNLASLYTHQYSLAQQFDKAEELHLKAIAIQERLAKQDLASVGLFLCFSYINTGTLYIQTERYDKAEEFLKKAYPILEFNAKQKPDVFEQHFAKCCNNLAMLYKKTGRYDEAEEQFVKTMHIMERLAQTNPEAYEPPLADCYGNMATFYDDTKQPEKAEAYCKKSIALYEKLARENAAAYEIKLAVSYFILAVLFIQTEQYDEAPDLLSKALPILEHTTKQNPAYEPYEANCRRLLTQLQEAGYVGKSEQ